MQNRNLKGNLGVGLQLSNERQILRKEEVRGSDIRQFVYVQVG